MNAVNIKNHITRKRWWNQNKPKQTNKPLVWKRDCGWPFLRDLFRHRWQSLPVFPSELTGSVQRPYLFRYFRCLTARLEIWSGGNGHEPQPAHRAAVVLQIPEQEKWWTVFRGCWNTVSSFCVSSSLRSLLNILKWHCTRYLTSRQIPRHFPRQLAGFTKNFVQKRGNSSNIARTWKRKKKTSLVARNLFLKGPGREAALLLPSNFFRTMLNGARLF